MLQESLYSYAEMIVVNLVKTPVDFSKDQPKKVEVIHDDDIIEVFI